MLRPTLHSLACAAIGVIFALLPFIAAAGGPLTDDVGHAVSLSSPPQRVVALAPELVELIYAIGCEERLVARTEYATFPPQAEALPSVGTYIQPNIERLFALKPDLVLVTGHGNPKEVAERLTSLGIQVYTYFPQSIQELVPSITKLGTVLGCHDGATKLAAAMMDELAQLKAPDSVTRPKVLILVNGDPLYAVGTKTLADDMIRWVGGQNVLSGDTRYPRISLEWVLDAQPDVLVLAHQGSPCETCAPPYWERLPLAAARKGQIQTLDPDLLSRAGPRLLRAAALLKTWLDTVRSRDAKP